MNMSEQEFEQLRAMRGVYGVLQTRLPDGRPWIIFVMDDSCQDDLENIVADVVYAYDDDLRRIMHDINVARHKRRCRRFIHARGLIRYCMVKQIAFGIWYAVETGNDGTDVWQQAEEVVRGGWENLTDSALCAKMQRVYSEMSDDKFRRHLDQCLDLEDEDNDSDY